MMAEFLMPSLGADMDDGTVVEWLVEPGDSVRRGDLVAVVKTDKADVDVEIFDEGTVDELLVPEGRKVPVGTPLATILPSGLGGAAAIPERAAPAAAAASEGERPRVSPRARRLAAQLDVDVDQLARHAPYAPISGDDVERVARSREGRCGEDRAEAMRRAIASTMTRSNREIPHYRLLQRTDLTDAMRWLDRQNAVLPVERRIVPAALLYRATAMAAREVPGLNGFWIDDGFEPSDRVHLGIAIALRDGGLIAPAIHDADRLSVVDLAGALLDLAVRARDGRLRSSELADPTITVTSLGERGVEEVHGLVYAPQVALVGFGKVVDRPWIVNGAVVRAPVVAVSLAGDHRASNGHLGARFLESIDRHLGNPETL